MKGFSAVHLLFAVLALVVGLVVGGLGPRGELRTLQNKLNDLEDRPCQTRTGADIAKIFQGRPWEEVGPGDDSGPAVPKPVPGPEETDGDEGGFNIRFGSGDDAPDDPENLAEVMDLARDALDLRHQQALAALREDADPTDEQMAAIETNLKKMNDDLISLAEDLREQMRGGEEPSRRDAMLYAAETLDVFLSAEDSMREMLSEDQIANLQDESLDPMSYVDPALIDVLQDLNR